MEKIKEVRHLKYLKGLPIKEIVKRIPPPSLTVIRFQRGARKRNIVRVLKALIFAQDGHNLIGLNGSLGSGMARLG